MVEWRKEEDSWRIVGVRTDTGCKDGGAKERVCKDRRYENLRTQCEDMSLNAELSEGIIF